MNDLRLNDQRMTSLEIAEVTGKRHSDLMRAIRNMEPAWQKVQGRKFAFSSKTYPLPNGGSKETPFYSLTKTECLYIATKFNDVARAQLVLRWEELEKRGLTPGPSLTPNPSPTGEGNFGGEGRSFTRRLLVSDQDVMGEAENIVGRRLNSCNQKSEDCITTRDIAEQYGMDARDLNSFLKDQGIQRWKRGQFRLTPEYEGRGLAEDRLFVYYSKDGKQKERTYLVWTKKGAEMISNILKN